MESLADGAASSQFSSLTAGNNSGGSTALACCERCMLLPEAVPLRAAAGVRPWRNCSLTHLRLASARLQSAARNSPEHAKLHANCRIVISVRCAGCRFIAVCQARVEHLGESFSRCSSATVARSRCTTSRSGCDLSRRDLAGRSAADGVSKPVFPQPLGGKYSFLSTALSNGTFFGH